jgi:hypothetical protein
LSLGGLPMGAGVAEEECLGAEGMGLLNIVEADEGFTC